MGPAGPKGDTGATGAVGATGAQGPAGLQGVTGPKGDAGASGATGDTGPQGPQGPVGNTGPAGPAGPKGDIGATGAQGALGLRGETGAKGDAGPQGAPGVPGPQGPQGAPGSNNIADIVGTVPNCVDKPSAAFCQDGAYLRISGSDYKKANFVDLDAAVETKVIGPIKTGVQAGVWNDVANFTDSIRLVTLTGSVLDPDGVPMAVNIGPALKVRIQAGKIQEMHTDAALSARELTLKVEFIPVKSSAAFARK